MKTVLLDSSAWIEFLADGPLAGQVAPYLAHPEKLLVPSVVFYEVYKRIKAVKGEEVALTAANLLSQGRMVSLDATAALTAADLGLSHHLSMADAFILATARLAEAELVTLDADFQGLPGTKVLSS